jgi:serine/threonine-protein kinase
MADPLLGTKIGSFLVEEELGRGGMGVVYVAQELGLHRAVALKVIAPHLLDDATTRTRFQREIANTVAIEHPHVVPVYSAGIDEGSFFIAMRYVRGADLWHIFREEGPLNQERVLRLTGQIASALYTVHQTGIVHRDIKPQNVLIWNPGEPDEHSFLTDFGIAKALNDVQRVTTIGALGTPPYMAPEVREGMPATPACDQYALAVMTFELLTGKLPFEDDDEIRDIPLPLSAYAPDVPHHVRQTIERALSPDPNDRFEDVRAFVFTDATARAAFKRSEAITETLDGARSPEQLVTDLHGRYGLNEDAIAEIADLRRTEVVRLRRQAARKALIGE